MSVLCCWTVLDRHHYLVLSFGEGYRNKTFIRVRNDGSDPIWCQFGNFKCTAELEGVDHVYTNPILPGCVREYSLQINPVATTYARNRRCQTVLPSIKLDILEFEAWIFTEQPDGMEASANKTRIFCVYQMPEGFSQRYKIVRHLR